MSLPGFCVRRGIGGLVCGLLGIAVLAATVSTTPAGEEPAPPAERSPRLEYLTEKAKAMRVHPADKPDALYRLQEAPLFRWQNPISGADGAIFVWTSSGRPTLLCKTHVNDKNHMYVRSFTSLSREPFVLTGDSPARWNSPQAGITPMRVGDVPAPAATENARLVQMRAIARRYELQSVWGEQESGEWELRLLPTPMMRYTSPEAGGIDGAIFGFAQGTNPEAVVLVEAVRGKEGNEWQSAPARLSGYAIRGSFDGAKILDTPRVNVTRDNETYRYVAERLSPYPFAP